MDVKYNLTAIEKKANTDYLTGIYNRNYLECTTNDWLQEASLKNEYIIFLLLDIDILNTLMINMVIFLAMKSLYRLVRAAPRIVGENEMIGRYGGDNLS